MAKDILLYGYIYEYSALYFHEQIREATQADAETPLILRVNTEGGSPEWMQSVIAKAQAIEEQLEQVIGESQMHSSGFFLMAYLPKEKISCIDTTKALLHRASYSKYIEDDPAFAGSIYEDVLKRVNKDLEAAMRARVDVEALEALPQMKAKGFTLKDIFKLDALNAVILGAKDLKKVGLVGKIIKITPTKVEESNAIAASFSKCRSFADFKLAASAKPEPDEPINNDIMDLAELKAKFPAIYAQAKAEGHTEGLTAGVAAEKDRVEAIMVYNEIDPVTVKAAIESGKPFSMKQLAELQLKAFSSNTLTAVKKDSAGNVITETTTETKEDAEKKRLAGISAELDKRLGLKPKAA
jgi:ATP-dependent protease ClpP protease subunit